MESISTNVKRSVVLFPRPADVEKFLSNIRLLYLDEGVEQFTVDKSKPVITTVQQVPAGQAQEVIQLLEETVRHKPMEEYIPESDDVAPFKQLFEMWKMVSEEGLEVSYILVGSRELFSNWLKVRLPRSKPSLFGVPIIIGPSLPTTTFVITGAITKESSPLDILFSVRGTLP